VIAILILAGAIRLVLRKLRTRSVDDAETKQELEGQLDSSSGR